MSEAVIYTGAPIKPPRKRYLVKWTYVFPSTPGRPDIEPYSSSREYRTKLFAMMDAEWRQRNGASVEVIDQWA